MKIEQKYIEALADVIKYMRENEHTSYEEAEEEQKENHIFEKVLILDELLNKLPGDDGTMESLAKKMSGAYVENVFWIDLDILADFLEIPKKKK